MQILYVKMMRKHVGANPALCNVSGHLTLDMSTTNNSMAFNRVSNRNTLAYKFLLIISGFIVMFLYFIA